MRLHARGPLAVFVLLAASQIASAQDPAGCWRGTWLDTNTGHSGPIRATITQCDSCHYRAVFSGRFFGVVPFRFSAVLTVTGTDGDATILSGTWNLPLFGEFTYCTRVTASCFVTEFCSRRYTGRFVMERECCGCGH